jgi:hypothetical protein
MSDMFFIIQFQLRSRSGPAPDSNLSMASSVESEQTTTDVSVTLKLSSVRQLSQTNAIENWDRFSQSILKKGYWGRLGNLTKSLTSLPYDIEAIYDEIEQRNAFRLNAKSRLMYYNEFTRAALGSTTLHFRDVEALITKKNPEIMMSTIDFMTLMTSKFHELSSGAANQAENLEYIDFKHFAALLYELFKHHQDTTRAKEGRWGVRDMLRQLPLDPDSKRKQIWDAFCMILLLYCSFAVPYSIAFESIESEDENHVKENFDVVTDVVFMMDICLNFVTAWDNQGFIVREFSLIAKNYMRTWFIPDVAGSFPFDKVITAFIESGPQSTSSSTVLQGLRLIRMIKLVRAVKFMTKLEKLKHQEGFEAFGAVITLTSAAFALFFTSHLLGCFYTILSTYEEGDNWLKAYSPELANADISTRYVVALYWAMVTIRFLAGSMGGRGFRRCLRLGATEACLTVLSRLQPVRTAS